MTKIRKVKTREELEAVTAQLAQEGYTPLRPSHLLRKGGKVTTWGDTVNSMLHVKPQASGKRGRAATVFFTSTGGEHVKEDPKIGSPNLGWMDWGIGNNVPNVATTLCEMLPYTAAAHKFNTDLCAGMGPVAMYRYTQYVGGNISEKEIPFASAGQLLRGMLRTLYREMNNIEGEDVSDIKEAYLEEIEKVKFDLRTWEKTNEELEEFEKNNDFQQTFLKLAGDQQMVGVAFPELILNKYQTDANNMLVPTSQWHPKVIGIRHHHAHTCRFERMDEHGKINYIYTSNRWLNNPYVTHPGTVEEVNATPCLDTESPVTDLKVRLAKTRLSNTASHNRPTRFFLPTVYPSVGRPYYPICAWYSIFSGDIYEYCFTMIEDRNIRKKNSNVIGRIIYIHHDYLKSLYTTQGAVEKKKSMEEFRDEIFSDVNTWLANRNNSGQPLVAFTFTGPDGKEHRSWEIVEIESNNKSSADANQKELQEVSSIIFFAHGLDSKLVGNTPGDTSSGGGTDLRERYLLKQLQMGATQELLLAPWKVAAQINEWDKHLVWRVRREVLTTLDNSKTGITEAEYN